jgi:membrane-bound lytic murein transglycosylase F
MYLKTYDQLFKEMHKKYSLPYDWRLLKAQCIQESGLNPNAKAYDGGMGLAQFMPKTFEEVASDLQWPFGSNPFSPELSIEAQAYYMRKLLSSWTAERHEIDRYCLALASYNAGMGNMLRSQKFALGANDYASIINKLDLVTGASNSGITKGYVKNILTIWVRQIIN